MKFNTILKTSYMKRIISFSIFYFFFGVLYAQEPVEVIYHQSEKDNGGEPRATLIFFNDIAYLSKVNDKSLSFIDYKLEAIVDMLKYKDSFFKTIENFDSLSKPVVQDETEEIFGYECKKAIYKAFSNTIEVWYTDKAPAKGSPYKNYLPKNSLVLKIKINGTLRLIVTDIRELTQKTDLFYPIEQAKEITRPQLRELLIKSKYVTIPVFDKQQINFDTELKNGDLNEVNKTFRCSNGTVILKKIMLPKINKEGASVFATLTNWSNGDAYDRTCSLFTISNGKEKSVLDAFKNGIKELPVFKDNQGQEFQGVVSTSNYEAPIELMRFFTSFGVSHFNKKREINNYKWRDSVVYKQEITNLIPNTEDEIWIGVFIGNYDKGGHKVSLDLNFYPSWTKTTAKNKYINPLFSTVNILEMSGQNYGKMFKTDTLETKFEIAKNIENLQLLYTSTGHGGWGGGDEFNPRLNQIFIDGKLVFSEVPWRTDCATYRLSNPASGNFSNGLSSSDLSRSNWCPATITPPKIIPLDYLKPGTHTIQVVIDQGDDEDSSFNHWGVTGVLTGQMSILKNQD
jgi:hypothetical protein